MSYLEINLAQLRRNLAAIRRQVGADVEVMPVIKTEAYGHGLLRCVRVLTEEKVHWVAVANIEEAVKIRRFHPRVAILILGPVERKDFGRALSGDFRLTIDAPDNLNFLATQARIYGRRARIHIKINTGMNRFGVEPARAVELVERARSFQQLLVEGVYSHLFDSDNQSASLEQWKKFNEVLFDFQKKGIEVPLRHLANSGAILNFDRSYFEIVRPGGLIYGLVGEEKLGVKPILSWRAKILKIRRLPAGACVGYSCAFKTKKLTDIGILDVGYADGYDRQFSNRAEVLVKGHRCPVIGLINMNYTLVDLTPAMRVSKRLSPQVGDEAILIGRSGKAQITAYQLAGLIQTDAREIVSRIPKEVAREYHDEKPKAKI